MRTVGEFVPILQPNHVAVLFSVLEIVAILIREEMMGIETRIGVQAKDEAFSSCIHCHRALGPAIR